MTNSTWKENEETIDFLAKVEEKNRADEAKEQKEQQVKKEKEQRENERLSKLKGPVSRPIGSSDAKESKDQKPKTGTDAVEPQPFKFKKTEGKLKLQNNEDSIEEEKRLAREKLEKLNQELSHNNPNQGEKKSDQNNWAKIGAEKFRPKTNTAETVAESGQVVDKPLKEAIKEERVNKFKKNPEQKEHTQKEEAKEQAKGEAKVSDKIEEKNGQLKNENLEKKKNQHRDKPAPKTGVVATKNVFAKWDD